MALFNCNRVLNHETQLDKQVGGRHGFGHRQSTEGICIRDNVYEPLVTDVRNLLKTIDSFKGFGG